MQIEQLVWTSSTPALPALRPATFVLVFGAPDELCAPTLEAIAAGYPSALLFGCSTAGEIVGTQVRSEGVSTTAVRLDSATARIASVDIDGPAESERRGAELAAALVADDLRHVLVLSDGLRVNGSALVAGLTGALPAAVTVSGGLSADGDRFERTVVVNGATARGGTVAALGLYGRSLTVSCASVGGWDPFGPERIVTESSGNVLRTLDGRSALDLYRQYLGPHADGLPATALLFPLSLRDPTRPDVPAVVRTVLGVDETEQTMTFAGEIPTGAYVRLMKANFDRLIDGAGNAGASAASRPGPTPDLAVLISCVGRRLVLRQRVEEEVEAVRDAVGPTASLTGFYSYGEISPFTPGAACELHNQTMTVTLLGEAT